MGNRTKQPQAITPTPAVDTEAPKDKTKKTKAPKSTAAPKVKSPKAPKTAAPKKETGGQKPMFTDPAEVQRLIDEYFEVCKGRLLMDDTTGKPFFDKWGHPVIVDAKPPTVTGLALALGFTNRVSLLNYQAKEEFADIITRAKSRVEEYAETRLYDRDGANGARFNLMCNFGWRENKDKDQDGGTATVRIVCDIPRSKVVSADGGYTDQGAEVSADGNNAA